MESKVCASCKERKPLSSFNKNNKAIDGHARSCKHCTKVRYSKSKNNKSFVTKYVDKVMFNLNPNDY